MANGPCQLDVRSCLNGPPCRAAAVLVPGLRPKAQPVGRRAVPRARRAAVPSARAGKKQLLDAATATLASGEEDEVVAALDLQPAIAGRRRRGGVRASQEGAGVPRRRRGLRPMCSSATGEERSG